MLISTPVRSFLVCLLSSLLLCACAHSNTSNLVPSELKNAEGIVFGKIESISYNGHNLSNETCSLASEGGLFNKKQPLTPGEYFFFKANSGNNVARFFCLFDNDIKAEYKLTFVAEPQVLNYLGRITLKAHVADNKASSLKEIVTPTGEKISGGFNVGIADTYKEDVHVFKSKHPQFADTLTNNAVPHKRK